MAEKKTADEGVQLTSPKGSRVTVPAEMAENMQKNFYTGTVDPRQSSTADASVLNGPDTVMTREDFIEGAERPAPVTGDEERTSTGTSDIGSTTYGTAKNTRRTRS